MPLLLHPLGRICHLCKPYWWLLEIHLTEQQTWVPFLVLHHGNKHSELLMTVFILAVLINTVPTTVVNGAVEFCFAGIVQTPSSINGAKKRHKDFYSI